MPSTWVCLNYSLCCTKVFEATNFDLLVLYAKKRGLHIRLQGLEARYVWVSCTTKFKIPGNMSSSLSVLQQFQNFFERDPNLSLVNTS